MFYKRKIYQNLLDWKKSNRRKPLVIRGARQVGKSTVIREFAKEYKFYIELNLEREQDKSLFELDSAKNVIAALSLREGIPLSGSSTLLFIDEIQESPKAIKLLRFFYEDFPDSHVICAGSLLEHVIKGISSFPVGRIQQLIMHPFDFEEFLWAKGKLQLAEVLNEVPLKKFAHEVAMRIFHEYIIVGGMPEAVKTFIESDSYLTLNDVYEEIWQTYKDDIEKYGKNDTEKKILRHVIETAAHEKDRISMVGFGKSNYKSREIGEALRSLDKTRLLQLVYPTTSTEPPQEIDFKRKPRLQFLDTGLLNHALGIQAQLIGVKDFNDVSRGRTIQHIVYQEVQSQKSTLSNKLHFWVREKANSSSEVDLVFHSTRYLIPVEVKSGAYGRLRSLHEFMDRTNHSFAVRLLANHLSIENVTTPKGKKITLMNLPYYLAFKIEKYIEWMIDNSLKAKVNKLGADQ